MSSSAHCRPRGSNNLEITAADSVTFSTWCGICSPAPASITLAGVIYQAEFKVPTSRLCERVIGDEDKFKTKPEPFQVIE